tara:strand:+ start:665 stop:1177 length:513 start_codon:yes stop_codon:yes gene_type:complete
MTGYKGARKSLTSRGEQIFGSIQKPQQDGRRSKSGNNQFRTRPNDDPNIIRDAPTGCGLEFPFCPKEEIKCCSTSNHPYYLAKWKYVEIKKKKQIGNQEGNVIVKQKLAEPKKVYWNLCPNRFASATRPKVLKDIYDSTIPIVDYPKKSEWWKRNRTLVEKEQYGRNRVF